MLRVPSLALPPLPGGKSPGPELELDKLGDRDAAIKLFVDRASAIRPVLAASRSVTGAIVDLLPPGRHTPRHRARGGAD